MHTPTTAKYVVGPIVGLALVLFIGACMLTNSICDNQTIAESKSPDGNLEAVVFQRDCGATTGFGTQVSIFRSWLPRSNNSGNVFASDTNYGAIPAGVGGGSEVKLRWRSPNELVIARHPNSRVFLAENEWGSVKVTYENLAD